MNHQTVDRPRILILFSDTGGGHRSGAEAIIEALSLEFGERIETTMVDVFKQYAPRPLNRVPEFYPHMVRVPQAWGLGYRLSNGQRRARLITASAWPYVRRKIQTLVSHHPSDLIVSVHPLANAPVLRALKKNPRPFVIVVTDLVTTHAFWYHRGADLILVPTAEASRRALKYGLDSAQVKVVGLPVAERFSQPGEDPAAIRASLGWPEDLPVILLVGGGEGMGPLEKTARTIASSGLKACLVVIAGRNKELKTRLEAQNWPLPTFIYGFVRDMPDFMRAADILVTKAGPGTLSEAFIAGLPLVLYSRLPGQEDGNVAYVTSRGAGVWAPEPKQVLTVLRQWVEQPELRKQVAEASRSLARPDAARRIACVLAEQLGIDSR